MLSTVLLASILSTIALTTSASWLIMTGRNATVGVEKTKTNMFAPYTVGSEYQNTRSSQALTIGCELRMNDSTELQNHSIQLQKLGHLAEDARPNVVSKLSADKRIFAVTLNLISAKKAKESAYICFGQANGRNASVTIAFLSVPLLSVSVEGDSVEKSLDELGDVTTHHGTRINVTCHVNAFPEAEVSWYRSEPEVKISTKSKLELAAADYYKDRGFYVCRANNSFGTNSFRIFLRVKNPRDYLKPLIILLSLVLVLVAIYIFYELRMREKRLQSVQRRAVETREIQQSVDSRNTDASPSAIPVFKSPATKEKTQYKSAASSMATCGRPDKILGFNVIATTAVPSVRVH